MSHAQIRFGGHSIRQVMPWLYFGRRTLCDAVMVPLQARGGKGRADLNYEVAHIYAGLRAIDDEHWVRSLVRDLTNRHETGRPNAWALEDAPAEFIAAQLKAVVGIEISVCTSSASANSVKSQARIARG